MIITDLDCRDLSRRFRGDGVALSLGAVRVRVRSDAPGLSEPFRQVYGRFPLERSEGFFDATVEVRRVRGIRRFARPQIELLCDTTVPFEPFPADTHLPLLEWGMNHALAERFLHSLLLHSGVVEKHGIAVVLPAIPGSGKSTLTAALMCRGYRLLSDEFGAYAMADRTVSPVLKPIALKNESIPEIRRRYPSAVLGPVFPKTRKGDVAHLAPSEDSVRRRQEPAVPGLILFPRFARGEGALVEAVDSVTAFGKLAVNSFNYEILGPQAFGAVAHLVRSWLCRRITFGDLDVAVNEIDSMVAHLRDRQQVQGIP